MDGITTKNDMAEQIHQALFKNDRIYKSKPRLEAYNPISHLVRKFEVNNLGEVNNINDGQESIFKTSDYGMSKIVNEKEIDTNFMNFTRFFKTTKPKIVQNPITGEKLDLRSKKSKNSSEKSSRQSVSMDQNSTTPKVNQRNVLKEAALSQISPFRQSNYDLTMAQQNVRNNVSKNAYKDPLIGREIKYNLPKDMARSMDSQNMNLKQNEAIANNLREQNVSQRSGDKQLVTKNTLSNYISQTKVNENGQRNLDSQNSRLSLNQQSRTPNSKIPRLEDSRNFKIQSQKNFSHEDFVYLYGKRKMVSKLAIMHPTGAKVTGNPSKLQLLKANSVLVKKKTDPVIKIQ